MPAKRTLIFFSCKIFRILFKFCFISEGLIPLNISFAPRHNTTTSISLFSSKTIPLVTVGAAVVALSSGSSVVAGIDTYTQLTGTFDAGASNLLLKDGTARLPHLHAHVVPRLQGDFAVSDMVFGLMDGWAPTTAAAGRLPAHVKLPLLADDERKDRTPG